MAGSVPQKNNQEPSSSSDAVCIQQGKRGFIGGSLTARTNAREPNVNKAPLIVNKNHVSLYTYNNIENI